MTSWPTVAAPAPPGPRGHFLFGSLPELSQDWLGTIAQALHTYGPIVRFRMPWPLGALVIVTDPRAIEQIFVQDVACFRKSKFQRMVAPVLGEGLVLAEGAQWRRQRRLVQPAFHRDRIAEYGKDIVCAAEAMVAAWPEQEVRDVYADAAQFSLHVAATTMFGAQLGERAAQVCDALAEAVAAFNTYFNARVPLPLWVPTPAARRMRRASHKLQAVVSEFIAARRRGGEDQGDLLGMLLQARDEAGMPLTDLQLRDEAVTLFVAGAETTAVALAWTLYLLARHPEVAAHARAEIAAVAGGSVRSEHVRSLRYTSNIIRESMRLYPPAWITGREAIRDCTIGSFAITTGTQVLAGPYWMHRDPRYFPDPERFSPERWTDELSERLPRFAYFPFAGGQRMCIGHQFAMVELVIAVATVLNGAELSLAEPAPVLQPGFTLRPRDGIRLTVRRRISRSISSRSNEVGPRP